MKLILLGTGGLIPTDTAQTACFLLPEVNILLDAGTGLYRINRYLQAKELDVYLTHAHGDHTSGLVYLFGSSLVNEIRHTQSVADGSNIGECVRNANEFLHARAKIHASQCAIVFLSKEYEPYEMNWQLLLPQEPLSGGGTITSFPVGHGEEIGFRLDWPGHSMAYVTDTHAGPDAPYLEHIQGVDLLLHDGCLPERIAKVLKIGHSSVCEAAQIAAQAQVGRLILVHRHPVQEWSIEADLDAAREIFPNIEMGLDGMEIDF